MKEDQAARKREEWAFWGDPLCRHVVLTRLYNQGSCWTGDYVCVECGTQIGRSSEQGTLGL